MQQGEVDREVEKVLSAVRGKGEANPLARLVVRDRSGQELARERERGIRRLAADQGEYSKEGIGRLLDAGIGGLEEEVLTILVEERATRCAGVVLARLRKTAPGEMSRWVQAAQELDREITRLRLVEIASDAAVSGSQRLAAVRVMSELGARDGVDALVETVARTEGVVQEEAYRELEKLTGAGIGEDLSGWQRWWQTNRGQPPQRWLRVRIQELDLKLKAERESRKAVVGDLAGLTREAILDATPASRERLLSAALKVDAPEVRAFAARHVGEWKIEGLGEMIVVLMQDEKAEVRRAAIEAMGMLGPQTRDNARGVMEAALSSDENAGVRAVAARALGKAEDGPATAGKRSIPRLLEALGDEDAEVHRAVIESLGELGATEAAPLMVEMLAREREAACRQALARVLGRIATPDGRATVEGALDDKELWLAYLDGLTTAGEYEAAWEAYGRYEDLAASHSTGDEAFAWRVRLVEAALAGGERELAAGFWRELDAERGEDIDEEVRRRVEAMMSESEQGP